MVTRYIVTILEECVNFRGKKNDKSYLKIVHYGHSEH
jgi:hypothetical protein